MKKHNPRSLQILAMVLLGVFAAWNIDYMYEPKGRQGGSQTVSTDLIMDIPAGLVDQNGKKVTPDQFAGKYLFVFFGFTHCPAICPAELGRTSRVIPALKPATRDKLAFIFVTLDPERDTVQVMKDYTGLFDPSIIGLTGSRAQIDGMVKDWKVYAARTPTEDGKSYTVDHSAFTYLVGPDRNLIKLFRAEDSIETVVNDLEAAVAE